MGYGDQIMATGLARGAAARGKRIAFGTGGKIIWDHNSPTIFKDNPNIAPPGSEGAGDIEWIRFHKGHRIYNKHRGDRWVWNYKFKIVAGELFFTANELQAAERAGAGFVIIEPNVPQQKSVAQNKQWPVDRYAAVAAALKANGIDVRQFSYAGGLLLPGVTEIKTASFRDALAVLSRARLYIGPEGGLHHGAAAVGIPGVVLFGGFIPPQVTGYQTHTNLTGGALACGSLRDCAHCRKAMKSISVDHVLAAARSYLSA